MVGLRFQCIDLCDGKFKYAPKISKFFCGFLLFLEFFPDDMFWKCHRKWIGLLFAIPILHKFSLGWTLEQKAIILLEALQ